MYNLYFFSTLASRLAELLFLTPVVDGDENLAMNATQTAKISSTCHVYGATDYYNFIVYIERLSGKNSRMYSFT